LRYAFTAACQLPAASCLLSSMFAARCLLLAANC
jgi:hypothetical protein